MISLIRDINRAFNHVERMIIQSGWYNARTLRRPAPKQRGHTLSLEQDLFWKSLDHPVHSRDPAEFAFQHDFNYRGVNENIK